MGRSDSHLTLAAPLNLQQGVPVPDISNLDENGDLYLAPGLDLKADGPVKPPKIPDRASVVRGLRDSPSPSTQSSVIRR